MSLSEIYQKGIELLENKNLGLYLRGVETEFVLINNDEIFKWFKFRQQAINSSEATTKTRLLDVDLEIPIVMSSITVPIPQIQEYGLLKVARALKEVGSMMSLGSSVDANVLKTLVEVGVPILLTVKPFADRNKLIQLITKAEAAGVNWIGVEVDAGQGTKLLDKRTIKDCAPMSVEELKDIKQKVNRPLVLKGILSPWDAEKALEVGADVIVVSNHGAHTIDYLPHPLEVMDEIVNVIEGEIPIIVDGGFRRGTDVLKGLAFGAQAVGLGRPILYGLAVDGEEGVKTVIKEIGEELKRVMTMTGIKSPSHAHKGIIL
ncbi:alpha-hydroxy-acid oxidizing protein [Chloroflexota bacterium]